MDDVLVSGVAPSAQRPGVAPSSAVAGPASSEAPVSLAVVLRAYRDRARPDQTMYRVGGPRRVRGLRREEVAAAAGISVDYYARLEQGRELRPSQQVLDALARVLQLHSEERRYLHHIVWPPWPHRVDAEAGLHTACTHDLPRRLSVVGAYMLDTGLNITAMTSTAWPVFARFPTPPNLARIVFVAPESSQVFPDATRAQRGVVAMLRLNMLHTGYAPAALVSELLVLSDSFACLWRSYELGSCELGRVLFTDPPTGVVEAEQTVFEAGCHGYRLVLCRASGSPRAEGPTS